MGYDNVIGPIDWTPKARLESWFTMRELREDNKTRKALNPVRYARAIEMQTDFIKKEFLKYVGKAA